MQTWDSSQLLGLVSELPVSDLGEKFLHLRPGSKLGLYLLGLSNLTVTPFQVELAEVALSRPLGWILEVIHENSFEGKCVMSMSELEAKLRNPGMDLLSFIPHPQVRQTHKSLQAYFAVALKSALVVLASGQVLLSLRGVRQLRHPSPVLPLLAFALSDRDNEGTFLRMIMAALAQAFADADWAIPGDASQVAVELLSELGEETEIESVRSCLQIFNLFVYGSGCVSPTDDTALVLLQYLLSTALQP